MHDSLRRLFLSGYLLLAICLALFTVYLCYEIEWRGPFRDLWEFIAPIRGQLDGHWSLASLAEPYGGIHRIFFPRLLFYLDYRFASGSNLLAMSVTIALHGLACGILMRHALLAPNREQAWWLIATILLCFASTTQIYNLIYISDNQVVIGNTFAVLAAAVFVRHVDNPRIATLVLANVIAVCASLSHGSSLMVWPAMLAVMFIERMDRRILFSQAVFATVAAALYVSGHDPLHPLSETIPLWQKMLASSGNIALHVPEILRYTGLHLSNPLSRDYPRTGCVVTYVSLIYVFHASWRIGRRQWLLQRGEHLWLTLVWYGFFIALITATGRLMYPNSALTDRFHTLVMTYWAAWFCLLSCDLKRHNTKLQYLPFALTLLLIAPWQYRHAESMAWLSSRVTIAHTAAITGITDMDTVQATLSHPLLMDKNNLVAVHNDYFRAHRLAYFSDDIGQWFVTPDRVFDAPMDATAHCSGTLDSAETFIAGDGSTQLRLSGHAFRDDTHTALAELLVLNAQHRVVGLARAHRAKGEFLPLTWRDARHSQWIGFVHTSAPLAFPLELVAKTSSGYCPVLAVPTEKAMPFNIHPPSTAGEMP